MPDVADRIRPEPRTQRAPKAASRARLGWLRALAPRKKSTVAGAALAAMMIGIVVNALALQHSRRVALAAEPALAAAPAKVAAVKPAAAASVLRQPPAVVEAPTPEPRPSEVPLARAPKPADAIADFLRAQPPDKRRLTLSAQEALAKLGFAVKATGALDAQTRSALREFEKSHHLPASAEISPKLVHSLKTAAR